MNYSTFYPKNELINSWYFFNIALLQRFSAFCEILISDWLDDFIQSAAPYVTVKCRESTKDKYTNKVKSEMFNFMFYSVIHHKYF